MGNAPLFDDVPDWLKRISPQPPVLFDEDELAEYVGAPFASILEHMQPPAPTGFYKKKPCWTLEQADEIKTTYLRAFSEAHENAFKRGGSIPGEGDNEN